MGMFIEQEKPKDYDCGYNLDLMIAALPRLDEDSNRQEFAERIVDLIKQSHPNWVDDNDESKPSWDHFFELADYNPEDYGVQHPFR